MFADAVIAMLDGTPGVYPVQEPPDPAKLLSESFPYCVVYSDPGRRGTTRMASVAHHARATVTVVTVGLSKAQATRSQERMVSALALKRPVVDGRVCGRLQHIGTVAVSDDEDVPDRTVWVGRDTFYVASNRA